MADSAELETVDPETGRKYFIVEGETHRQAMQALQRQQNYDAIAEGIAQMEASEGQPLEETETELRKQLGFPPRT